MNSIFENILWLRMAQFKINYFYKLGYFKIPIHLAFGHETLAACINKIMKKNDHILLSHRNIHYNLLKTKKIMPELNEFLLKKNGSAGGKLGSMNLSNRNNNIEYTSSILGNNIPVACGVAFAKKIKKINGISIVVTGDGAIEEGTFYESLILAKSLKIPIIFLVENNEWSLGTSIEQRRCEINLNKICESIGISYSYLEGNEPFKYYNVIRENRKLSIKNNCPVVIEVKLKTLGYFIKKDKDNPLGRYINYHAGPAKELNSIDYPLIENSTNDPVFILKNHLSKLDLSKLANKIKKQIDIEVL